MVFGATVQDDTAPITGYNGFIAWRNQDTGIQRTEQIPQTPVAGELSFKATHPAITGSGRVDADVLLHVFVQGRNEGCTVGTGTDPENPTIVP